MRLSKILMGSLVVIVSITRVLALILLSSAATNVIAAANIPSVQTPSNASSEVSTMAPVTRTIPTSEVRDVRSVSGPNANSSDPKVSYLKVNNGLALQDVGANTVATPSSSNSVSSPAIAAPSANANFEGLHTTIDCTVPPDSDGTVGPTYYVAFVNNYNNCATQTPSGNVGFFLKANGTLAAAFYYPSLFSGFTTGCRDPTQHSDPQVVYDSGEDRYFFTTFTTTSPFQMCLASTLSNNPVNGPYCLASYATQGGNVPDYEKTGVWIDGFYVTYNPSPSDSRTVVFNKSDFETCNSSIRLQDFDMGSDKRESDNFCTPQPNHIFRPVPATYNIFTGGVPAAGEPEFLVSSFCQSGHVYVYTLHVDWATSANSLLTRATIAVQSTHFAPNSVSSPANPLDTLNLHLMTPANYIKDASGNEYLWTTMTVCNGSSCSSGSGASAIAWYQLKLTNGNAAATTVKNQNVWEPDSTSRLQAAAAFDRQGNVLMDYTQVSSSQNSAVAYAGRLVGDPPNTLNQTETILFRGPSMGNGACNTSPCVRWGDYSSNFIDPDGCTFWFTHEYYKLSDPWQWDTRIGAAHYPSCTPLTYGNTVTPTSISFTSLGVGVTTPPQAATVSNTGTGPLVVQPPSITGPNAVDFNVSSDNCSTSPTGIPGGTSCTIQVTCTPSGTGLRTAKLNVKTNVAAADSAGVTLSCGSSLPTLTSLACAPSTVAIRQSTVCTAMVNDVSPGTLTPSGAVDFASTVPTSTFSSVNCVLTGTNSSAACAVSYSQTGTETAPTITASYVGDSNHLASSGNTTLTVFLLGDVNGDCKVDIVDVATVAAAFDSTPGSPNWNPVADLDHDGKVDIIDVAIAAAAFGSAC